MAPHLTCQALFYVFCILPPPALNSFTLWGETVGNCSGGEFGAALRVPWGLPVGLPQVLWDQLEGPMCL